MFTGLIEAVAEILEVTPQGLTITRPASFMDVKAGSSISVSGVCLTVTRLTEKSFSFDVVAETWRRTTFGSLQKGDKVNLERALPASGRFEGHIVQGHVDAIGKVGKVGKESHEGSVLTIAYPKVLRGLIVEKGSIAVDGVSLTVTCVDGETFSTTLIPSTLQQTTLGTLREGTPVNLETDILGKYVIRLCDENTRIPLPDHGK